MKKFGGIILSVGILLSSFSNVAQASTTYTVEKGDTLYRIATNQKMTVAELKALNHLNNDSIFVNQKLVVKQTTKQETTPTTTKQTVSNSYTVAKGENLTKIATKLGLSITDLKAMNNLKDDHIRVGQVLKYNNSTANKQAPIIKKLSVADQQIAAQLLKEKAITQGVSQQGKIKYANVIKEAKKLIGTPYVFGGNTPKGIDCSGFIYYTFQKAGYVIPRLDTLTYFMKSTTKVEQPVPGDIVFFKNTYRETISHMGIYLGDNLFIHAGSNKGVEISNLNISYWKDRFVAIKRFNTVK